MLQELQELWDAGFQFVLIDDWGEDLAEDFEDVEDVVGAGEYFEYIDVDYSIDYDERVVYLRSTDDE